MYKNKIILILFYIISINNIPYNNTLLLLLHKIQYRAMPFFYAHTLYHADFFLIVTSPFTN